MCRGMVVTVMNCIVRLTHFDRVEPRQTRYKTQTSRCSCSDNQRNNQETINRIKENTSRTKKIMFLAEKTPKFAPRPRQPPSWKSSSSMTFVSSNRRNVPDSER